MASSLTPALTGVRTGHRDATAGVTASPRSILFLSPSGQVGGAERVLLDMIAALGAAARVTLVTSADGPLVAAARSVGAHVTVMPFPRALASLGDAAAGASLAGRVGLMIRTAAAAPAVARQTMRLRAMIAEVAPDVVHSNGAKMHILSALAVGRSRAVVWHLHEYVSARPFMRRALRALRGRASAMVAISASIAADATAHLGAGAPVITMMNAVDTSLFSPSGPRLDLDALVGMSPPDSDAVRVGLVATTATWKGHAHFLDALGELPADAPVRGYVIGGPLYETVGSQFSLDELRAMAAQRGLGKRVGFTGHVADVPAAMRALDIVVHASTEREPFGLVIAEAMACGRPVITSGTGGAVEVASAGEGGIVVAPGDAPGLARAILACAQDAARRATLGRAARETALRRFDRARLAHELQAVYATARSRVPA